MEPSNSQSEDYSPVIKRVKIDEHKESENKEKHCRDTPHKEEFDVELIKKQLDEKLKQNASLSKTFANLRESFHKMSTSSKADEVEISKRQDNFSQKSQRTPPTLNQPGQFFSPQSLFRAPNKPSEQPKKFSLEDKNYYNLISMLLGGQNQPPQVYQNPLVNLINPNTQLLVKSLVMQDLFTNAFKSLLRTSKPMIIKNISESLGMNMSSLAPTLLDVLRRQPGVKRKNTDLMTSETIESDMPNQMGGIGLRQAQNDKRTQMNISSFFNNTKNRSQSMTFPQTKQDSLNWDPKEEKKQ
jgi:hypothetical protein